MDELATPSCLSLTSFHLHKQVTGQVKAAKWPPYKQQNKNKNTRSYTEKVKK